MGDIYQNPESRCEVFVNAFRRKTPHENNRHIVDKANELWKNIKSDESKVSDVNILQNTSIPLRKGKRRRYRRI